MNILIVYQEIPEHTKLYSVEVAPEDWKWMQLTQNKFINMDMPEKNENACNKLSKFLVGQSTLSMDEAVKVEGHDYVLVTGFLL